MLQIKYLWVFRQATVVPSMIAKKTPEASDALSTQPKMSQAPTNACKNQVAQYYNDCGACAK